MRTVLAVAALDLLAVVSCLGGPRSKLNSCFSLFLAQPESQHQKNHRIIES